MTPPISLVSVRRRTGSPVTSRASVGFRAHRDSNTNFLIDFQTQSLGNVYVAGDGCFQPIRARSESGNDELATRVGHRFAHTSRLYVGQRDRGLSERRAKSDSERFLRSLHSRFGHSPRPADIRTASKNLKFTRSVLGWGFLYYSVMSLAGVLFAMRGLAGDWPQFLGPTRDGIYTGADIAPAWPAAGPPVVWKKDVGEGFAGPMVASGKVILFHRVSGQRDH